MTQNDPMVLDGTVTSENGRNNVHFERHFDVPADELWSAVTEPERMKGWIGGPVEELELKEGGNVVIHIHPAGPATVYGKVLSYDPGHLLELTWEVPAWGKVPDLLGTTMRWEVLPEGSGSKFLLTHALPDEAGRVAMFLGAWHAHLDELPHTLAGKTIPPFEDERMFAMRAAYEAHLGSAS
ncbi:SRPBCC domain-containing protein [Streptomyces sp. NPDC057199]|uniref:SRPBCC domain-containing protein n=1 Tax=Streptomyces sp. NPDC057199 TaxID=3346047 RepID=UPI0036252215